MWPFGESTSDRLKEAMGRYPFLSDVQFKIKKKTAVFEGKVDEEKRKDILKIVAKSINGIEDADVDAVTVTNPNPQANTAQQDTQQQDIQIAERVSKTYSHVQAEDRLRNVPIDVVRDGNRVIVRGAVGSEEERQLVEQIAKAQGDDVDVSAIQVIKDARNLNQTDDDGDIVYTVQSGDTLSHIALHYYGDATSDAYMKIANANGLDDPNKIQAGQKLKIPGTYEGPEARLG